MYDGSFDNNFIDVYVEPHDDLPDGASLRYKAESNPERVRAVVYETDDGDEGEWLVSSPGSDGSDLGVYHVLVEDSGAGTSSLVFGDEYGLRLTHQDTGKTVAEAYLLLHPDDVIC